MPKVSKQSVEFSVFLSSLEYFMVRTCQHLWWWVLAFVSASYSIHTGTTAPSKFLYLGWNLENIGAIERRCNRLGKIRDRLLVSSCSLHRPPECCYSTMGCVTGREVPQKAPRSSKFGRFVPCNTPHRAITAFWGPVLIQYAVARTAPMWTKPCHLAWHSPVYIWGLRQTTLTKPNTIL